MKLKTKFIRCETCDKALRFREGRKYNLCSCCYMKYYSKKLIKPQAIKIRLDNGKLVLFKNYSVKMHQSWEDKHETNNKRNK